jgi:hypothetical protein
MMRTRVVAAVAVMMVLLAGLGDAHEAWAQEGITVIADSPRNEFPAGVTFALSFTSDAPVEEVRLQYRLAPDGTGATGVAECNEASTINCTYTLISGNGIYVIPGAEITYKWVVEDADGNRSETEERLYIHEDTRFDFNSVTDGNVTVYFHPGTEAEAPAVLAASRETLDRIGALEATQVAFPVKVFLYETAQEMQPAIVPGAGRGVQILGEVVYSDTAMVSADVDTLDITRHEIAHIVTREATKGPFGVPGWINEGIAVYAQTEPLGSHATGLEAAISNDRVLTMAELQSSSLGSISGTVGVYYGQSGSIIAYLVETYGEAKFADLMRVFKEGATPNDAFEQVYGFDALGLENEWRASVGLEPRVAAPTPTAQPTEEVRGQPTSQANGGGSSAADDSGDDGGMSVSVASMALIALLLAGAVGAGVWTLSVARARL